jgi:hypothetical protein
MKTSSPLCGLIKILKVRMPDHNVYSSSSPATPKMTNPLRLGPSCAYSPLISKCLRLTAIWAKLDPANVLQSIHENPSCRYPCPNLCSLKPGRNYFLDKQSLDSKSLLNSFQHPTNNLLSCTSLRPRSTIGVSIGSFGSSLNPSSQYVLYGDLVRNWDVCFFSMLARSRQIRTFRMFIASRNCETN